MYGHGACLAISCMSQGGEWEPTSANNYMKHAINLLIVFCEVRGANGRAEPTHWAPCTRAALVGASLSYAAQLVMCAAVLRAHG